MTRRWRLDPRTDPHSPAGCDTLRFLPTGCPGSCCNSAGPRRQSSRCTDPGNRRRCCIAAGSCRCLDRRTCSRHCTALRRGLGVGPGRSAFVPGRRVRQRSARSAAAIRRLGLKGNGNRGQKGTFRSISGWPTDIKLPWQVVLLRRSTN